MDEEDFAEDEDSVNIDGYDDENLDSAENLVNNCQQPGKIGPPPTRYSGFSVFPYAYRQDGGSAPSDELTKSCDSERNRESFSELGHFSAFRYLHQSQENSSPRRYSPEFSYSKAYPVQDNTEGSKNQCSGSKKDSELLEFSARHSNPSSTMLEHKLPFNFLGPPLAALHSMTEMKSSLGGAAGGGGDSNNNSTSAPSMSSPNAGLTAQTMHGQANAPNPHGIDTILSRPPPVTSAGLSSLTAG